ncbi:hypothetical protein FYK55_10220 [Roseiconus nitratireducens]|uniref:Uncharacterized protein n=1 Tax=Roseiconus nitratireducens TaxID=2605748 RepID=A0A5M6D7S3_9BACT|nr:hypothetical protein [Roseiconus nitratireducens]KAA5543581.1 hypothetical protein FYK55_10220 [Roseiconus nitratireducens]
MDCEQIDLDDIERKLDTMKAWLSDERLQSIQCEDYTRLVHWFESEIVVNVNLATNQMHRITDSMGAIVRFMVKESKRRAAEDGENQ